MAGYEIGIGLMVGRGRFWGLIRSDRFWGGHYG